MATRLEELHKKIEELQKEAEALTVKEKASVIEDIRTKVRLYGITPRELGYGSGRESSRSVAPIKYRLGDHTWSGKGRKPAWLVNHLASGGTLEDLQK